MLVEGGRCYCHNKQAEILLLARIVSEALLSFMVTHLEGDTSLPDPGYTPFYVKFFEEINFVKDKAPLNPVLMSVKECYQL